MAAEPRSTTFAAPARRPSPVLRIAGLGSVFGKAIRDSRPGFLLVTALLSGLMFAFGKLFVDLYPTDVARKQFLLLVEGFPPIARAMFYGASTVNLDTLGGYISQDDGLLLKLIPGLWSILVLGGSLATEVRHGSLEFVAATPLTKRRIALEKLGAHVATMAAAMAIVAIATWFTGKVFEKLPGDFISPWMAVSYAVWLGLTGLVAGSVAFALAPLLGRAAATGVASALLFGGYLVSSYQEAIRAFSGIAKLSWFTWTAGHNPLAGEYDWPSLGLVAIVSLVFFTAGLEAFARRDLGLGPRSTPRLPDLPDATLGCRGPVSRTFGEVLPLALAWGAGIGVFGLVMAASSGAFAEQLARTPDIAPAIRAMFPKYDITTTGGALEADFMLIAFVLIGLATSGLVGRWAADESGGRLELLLSTPLTRLRWVITGGLAVYLAVAGISLISALGVGVGAVAAGGDAAAPVIGAPALGVYGIGLAGVGIAVGGLLRTTLAAPVVATLAVVTFLVDLLAPPLKLPDWVHQLALTAHMGQPLVGSWNWMGMAVALALALGGLIAGGLGMCLRDVRR